MKIRLYRGPFDGKVLNGNFAIHAIVTGDKKLTREQQYEWRAKMIDSNNFMSMTNGGKFNMLPSRPQVRAEYSQTRFQHPDGSVFYEWTGYSTPYGPQL